MFDDLEAPWRLRVSRWFEPEPEQVCAARGFVTSAVQMWSVRQSEVALLVSEVATNAVLHARSDFEITVVGREDRIRVEVFDRNTRLPTLAVVAPYAYSGRGLALVQALALAWGVESHSADGKTIWFEVLLDP